MNKRGWLLCGLTLLLCTIHIIGAAETFEWAQENGRITGQFVSGWGTSSLILDMEEPLQWPESIKKYRIEYETIPEKQMNRALKGLVYARGDKAHPAITLQEKTSEETYSAYYVQDVDSLLRYVYYFGPAYREETAERQTQMTQAEASAKAFLDALGLEGYRYPFYAAGSPLALQRKSVPSWVQYPESAIANAAIWPEGTVLWTYFETDTLPLVPFESYISISVDAQGKIVYVWITGKPRLKEIGEETGVLCSWQEAIEQFIDMNASDIKTPRRPESFIRVTGMRPCLMRDEAHESYPVWTITYEEIYFREEDAQDAPSSCRGKADIVDARK